MNLIGIKVPKGGAQGGTVVYRKNEMKSKVQWTNTVEKDITWPVQGEFLEHMEALSEFVINALGLPKSWKGKMRGISFELKPAGYVISAVYTYNPYGSKFYNIEYKTFAIAPEHDQYDKIEEHIEVLANDLKDYMSTQTEVDTRQLMMDLYDQGKIKLPDGMELSDNEDPTPEQLSAYAKALEKMGAIVILDDAPVADGTELDPDDEDDDEDSDTATEVEELDPELEEAEASAEEASGGFDEEKPKKKNLKVA